MHLFFYIAVVGNTYLFIKRLELVLAGAEYSQMVMVIY